jgi:hypothetical protein
VRNHITAKALQIITAILSLVPVVVILQSVIFEVPLHLFLQFVIGAAMVIAGMVLFLLRIEIEILPTGKALGGKLDKPGTAIAFVLPVEQIVGVIYRYDKTYSG